MRILYFGNFRESWRTEPQVSHALKDNGHTVQNIQISESAWRTFPNLVKRFRPDVVFWTNNSRLAPRSLPYQQKAVQWAKDEGIFTAAFHLDRYWDLAREYVIYEEPWFQCDLVMTADGGNDDRFRAAGVNHQWVAPAVHGPDCIVVNESRSAYRAKVAFVGSWDHYHPEWPWRMEMLRVLRYRYGSDFRVFPLDRRKPIRGFNLSTLYASVDVVVGDSIFAGTPKGDKYWSDRPYETIGRGGVLAFPYTGSLDRHFTDGQDLQFFEAGNPNSMIDVVERLLADRDQRHHLKMHGYNTIMSNHQYYHRTQEMVQRIVEQKCQLVGWDGEVRPGTHDGTVVREVWMDDVYKAKEAIQPGDLVVDIGANVGIFSVYAAKLGADVISVEPFANNVQQLKKNIEYAGVADKITVIPVGAGEREGKARMSFFDVDRSQSFFRTDEGEIEIDILPLSKLLPDRPIAFLKMDIEGSEIFALKNADLRNVNRISIETHNTPTGTTHEAVKAILRDQFDLTETGGHSEGYVWGVRK